MTPPPGGQQRKASEMTSRRPTTVPVVELVLEKTVLALGQSRVRLGLPVAAFVVEKLLRVIDLGRTADALRNEGGDDG